ncbi:hypothetical protein Tco_1321370 [Tanacetum coccineum]
MVSWRLGPPPELVLGELGLLGVALDWVLLMLPLSYSASKLEEVVAALTKLSSISSLTASSATLVVGPLEALPALSISILDPSCMNYLFGFSCDKKQATTVLKVLGCMSPSLKNDMPLREYTAIKGVVLGKNGRPKYHTWMNYIQHVYGMLPNILVFEEANALAISTTEAEYVSARKACQQALWMKQALVDYGVRLEYILIMCDNKGAIDLSKNPIQHSQTKHIEIHHHFLRDNIQKWNIFIEKVSSKDNIDDILTKPLKREPFNYLRLGLGMMEQTD